MKKVDPKQYCDQLYPVDYTFQIAAIVMYLCDQTESFKLW